MTIIQLKIDSMAGPQGSDTVSLDRQKDILGDFSMNPTYL